MRALVLTDLKLGLGDLIDQRTPVLLATAAGKLYYPRLVYVRIAIDALPPSVTRERPLAEALAEADAEHDDFGAALWHYIEAIRRAPDVGAETRASALRIRDAFIPTLAILQASYATEAAGAVIRRPMIAALRTDLDAFPLPDQRTLLAWAEGFVAKGHELSVLLKQRANTKADLETTPRTRAGSLRSEAIGLLSRFRSALGDEFADRPAVARDRDFEIFAFLDQLAGDRQNALRRRSSAEARRETPATSEAITAPIAGGADAGTPD
jgi:hypothetical protein